MKTFIQILPLLAVLTFSSCEKEDVSPSWETGEAAGSQSPPPTTSGGGNPTTPPPSGGNSNLNGALAKYFPQGILDTSGNQISASQLSGKHVGIYFGAHWHPLCHDFTSKLVNFRNSNSSEFEVVFVSLCNSEAEKTEFMKKAGMRWLTIPGARSKHSAALAEMFDVQAMPQMVVLDPNGNLVTSNGDQDINNSGGLSKWKRG